MAGQKWSQNPKAGKLAPKPGFSAPREEKTQNREGGSKEGGKLPSGETSLGILAKEAFSLFCEGAERKRKGGKNGGIRGIEAEKKRACL